MRTKITDNWEVELTNDRGDKLTLKGEWYVDFFKEYDNKQLIIAEADVVGQSEQLVCSCRLVKTTGGYHCGNAKCSV